MWTPKVLQSWEMVIRGGRLLKNLLRNKINIFRILLKNKWYLHKKIKTNKSKKCIFQQF